MEQFCELPEDDGNAFRWIRVEKGVDKTLSSVVTTRHDVLREIKHATETQATYSEASLYARRWKHLETGTLNGFAIDQANDSSFTVVQFNTLAEGLSMTPEAIQPFQVDKVYGQSEKSIYGGFSNVLHPDIVFDFSLRRWRLLEVLIGKDGSCPFDLIALEEVDRFYGFFRPMLRLFGYDGVFVPKTRSPSVRMGWYSDGCALFWKTNMFDVVSYRKIEYKVGSQVLLLAWLRHKATDQHILVCVTHLKAQQSETNEKIRSAQVREMVSHVKEELGRQNAFDTPVLVLGDFNADVPSQTGCETSAIRDLIQSNLSPSPDGLPPYGLNSAYDIDPPSSSNYYTTWKMRGTRMTRRIIDYIFYGGNLSCQAHLVVPQPEELSDDVNFFPNLRQPSDHVAIAAKFEFGRSDTS
jgi:mRNA deadenylase 3'-5' endonuclease subunit Ccr4